MFSPSWKASSRAWKGLQAHRRLDDDLQDGVGLVLGDLLDLHAAALGGDDADSLGLAIEHIAEIELALERLSHFDIDPLHGLALGPGLDGDQTLAEQLLRRCPHLVIGLADPDAAGLASGACMDLRLYRPAPAAELGRRIDRLVGAEGDSTLWHRHTELCQQFLGLILMHVHLAPPCASSWRGFVPEPSAQFALYQSVGFLGHSFRTGQERLQFLQLSVRERFVSYHFHVGVDI